MSQKHIGVFVRLPLSEEQAHSYLRESSGAWDECNGSSDAIACESGLLSIGAPVTGGELHPVGYINEDAIGGLATGVYQSASLFRDDDKEHYDTVALVRLSDAQAQLAARDAEILRKDARIAELEEELSGFRAGLSELVAKEVAALKGGAAWEVSAAHWR